MPRKKPFPTKEQIEETIKISKNFSTLMNNLGICRKPKNITKLKEFVRDNNIDLKHADPAMKNINVRKYKRVEKECPLCKKMFETLKGHRSEKRCCSSVCANKFFIQTPSEEIKEKISTSLKNYYERNGKSAKIEKLRTCVICNNPFFTTKKIRHVV